MARTKASIQDGRLTIFTEDAIEPGVVTLAAEQARAGAFEIAGDALQFRPQGRKTSDLIARYASRKQADAALRAVFAALSGRPRSSGLGKIILYGVLGPLGLIILWSVIASFLPTPGADAPAVAQTPQEEGLPVGEPFPVDTYIQQMQQQPTE